jgi:glutathione S-transferase
MLTIHHLGKSQSERIIWLCEELGVPYELKRYTRDLSPYSLRLSLGRYIPWALRL